MKKCCQVADLYFFTKKCETNLDILRSELFVLHKEDWKCPEYTNENVYLCIKMNAHCGTITVQGEKKGHCATFHSDGICIVKNAACDRFASWCLIHNGTAMLVSLVMQMSTKAWWHQKARCLVSRLHVPFRCGLLMSSYGKSKLDDPWRSYIIF